MYSQKVKDTATLRPNFSLAIGVPGYLINSDKVGIAAWGNAFPTLNLPHLNASQWQTDDRLGPSENYAIAFMIAFGFPFRNADRKWFQKTEWSSAVSWGWGSCYERGIERFEGNTAYGETFYREMYFLQADCEIFSIQNAIVHQTPYYGRKKRTRFGYGVGLSMSQVKLWSYLSHIQGNYISTCESENNHPWYTYPGTALNQEKKSVGTAFIKKYGIGYYFPLSIEFGAGKKRRWHLGIPIYVGSTFLNPINGQHFTLSGANVYMNLRYDF